MFVLIIILIKVCITKYDCLVKINKNKLKGLMFNSLRRKTLYECFFFCTEVVHSVLPYVWSYLRKTFEREGFPSAYFVSLDKHYP